MSLQLQPYHIVLTRRQPVLARTWFFYLGGGSFDVSLLTIEEDIFEVNTTAKP
jgi:hypothetical protein